MKSKSFADEMHLQWFGVLDDPNVETEDSEDFEIVDEGDGDDDGDGKITLSPEEFQSLKSQGDSASALRAGIAELGEVLNKSGSKGNGGGGEVAVQQPGESWDAFKSRMSDSLFGDKTGDVLEEFVDRKLQPLIQQIGGITGEQSKDILRVKPETSKYFNKYQKDIEEYHDSLPVVQRNNPKSWEYAYNEVLKKKQDEIVEERVMERFDDLFAQKMQELGLEDGTPKKVPGSRAVFSEGGGAVVGVGGGSGGKRKKVVATAEERAAAERLHVDIKDYLLAMGRLD